MAGFNTGELVDYDIKVPSAIGRLKGIRLVRADADNSNSCSGWFVERVRAPPPPVLHLGGLPLCLLRT